MTTPIDHRPEFSSPTAATHGWYGNLRQFVDTRAPLLLLGATLAGLLLRLIPLGSSSAGDEISTYYVLHGHSLSRVLQLVHSNQETSPPAYFVVAWLFNQVVRDTALAARLVSYLAGVAAIPLTYVLGRVTVQRRATSLLAASLVALAPFVIFLSTDGRAFMFVMTAALVSTIALLKAVHTGRIRWWSAYALSSGIAVYTHYTVAFLLLLQALWALVAYRRRWKGVIVANMVVAVAYVPWLPGLAQDLKAPNGLNALVPFSAGNVGNVTLDWWVGHPVIPVDRLPGYLALALVSIAVVAGATGALLGSGGGGAPAGRWPRLPELLLIVLLAAGPLLLVALYSATGTTILDARNVISSWPALALVMATLVATPRAVWVRVVALVLLISGYSIGAVKSIEGNNQRPDLDAVVGFIDHHVRENAPIVDVPLFDNPLSELDVALSRGGVPPTRRALRATRIRSVPPLINIMCSASSPRHCRFSWPTCRVLGVSRRLIRTPARARLRWLPRSPGCRIASATGSSSSSEAR